jgi:hypothetical protein
MATFRATEDFNNPIILFLEDFKNKNKVEKAHRQTIRLLLIQL